MKTKEKIDLESKYSKKIQQLFELKRDGYLKLDNESFKGYEKFGFTKEDIPELIELAMDDSSDKIDYEIYEEECDRHFFATISAVRILGKLGAIEAIEPFFNKMYFDFDNDFYQEAIIDFLGDIGTEAIPFIENDLLKVNDDKLTLFDGLGKIIKQHPNQKDRVENFLIKYLNTTNDDSTHIAFAILLLVDTSGAKHINFIENIFKTRDVDTLVQGDFEDIEIKLGLKENIVHPRQKTKFDELIEAFALEEDKVIIHPVRTKPKIGRNDPCPCGSGKKYKKCCLNK